MHYTFPDQAGQESMVDISTSYIYDSIQPSKQKSFPYVMFTVGIEHII